MAKNQGSRKAIPSSAALAAARLQNSGGGTAAAQGSAPVERGDVVEPNHNVTDDARADAGVQETFEDEQEEEQEGQNAEDEASDEDADSGDENGQSATKPQPEAPAPTQPSGPTVSDEDLALLQELKNAGGIAGLIRQVRQAVYEEVQSATPDPVAAQPAVNRAKPTSVQLDLGEGIYIGADGKRYGPGKVWVPNTSISSFDPDVTVASLLEKRISKVEASNQERKEAQNGERRDILREARRRERRMEIDDEEDEE